jgi:methylmalonyl-CoA mutase N-terminal domain/subunit
MPAEGYWEVPPTLRTESGYEPAVFYTEADLPGLELPDPGVFPYTRGLYRDGYRGRLWTRREIAGFGAAADTNERFKYLLSAGATGLNCHFDLPTHLAVDADHPLADGEIGGAGPSICILADMRELMRGIRADEVSMSLISSTTSALVLLPMYVMVAEESGAELGQVRGTIQNDPLHARYCGYEASCPVDLSLRSASELMTYCREYLPLWYTNNVNMYDLREHGISAAQELAFGFGLAFAYLDRALERGGSADDLAARMAFYCSLHRDLLEEVAKLRAARQLWARLLTARYGVPEGSRSVQFRIGSQTAGSTVFPQQPLSNIVRIAYQALSGALAGVSSIHCCGFDEAIGLPSPMAHKLAVRTQQILAYETGVTLVADPLGGSYYVEAMTRQIADDATQILADVDAQGGMLECVRSGWLEHELARASLAAVQEIETGDRRLVGVNYAVEEPDQVTPGGVHEFSAEINDRRIREITEFKARRDRVRVADSLGQLRAAVRAGRNEPLLPLVRLALASDASLGEITGTVREASGLHYDPLGVISSPFGDGQP